MSTTRANILAGGKDVYIGPSTVTATTAGNYAATPALADHPNKLFFIGAVKEGSIKLNGNPFEESLHDGTNFQTGIELKMEIEGLESDLTSIGAIENLLDHECNIVLFPIGSVTGSAIKVGSVGVSVGYSGVFTRKNANTFKLTAVRHADKFTTGVTSITVA